MQKINIIAVGTLKQDYLKDAQADYCKRLASLATLSVIQVKEQTSKSGQSKLDAECKDILSHLSNLGGMTYLLDIHGTAYTSNDIATALTTDSTINYIIGGSNGVSQELRDKIRNKLSLGCVTLPHTLCRIVLLEQIYRGYTINSGRQYHK